MLSNLKKQRMQKLSLIAAIIALSSLMVMAQTPSVISAHPDFSGVWKWEAKGASPRELAVTHGTERIEFVESFEFEKKPFSNTTILFTDKRGEKNILRIPNSDFDSEVTSRTYWRKDKLIRSSTYSTPVETGAERFLIHHSDVETYSLSKDGNILTVERVSRVATPFSDNLPPSMGKRVFVRKH